MLKHLLLLWLRLCSTGMSLPRTWRETWLFYKEAKMPRVQATLSVQFGERGGLKWSKKGLRNIFTAPTLFSIQSTWIYKYCGTGSCQARYVYSSTPLPDILWWRPGTTWDLQNSLFIRLIFFRSEYLMTRSSSGKNIWWPDLLPVRIFDDQKHFR